MNQTGSGSTSQTSYTASWVFDSPVIYGVRVETSNPYHLLYIEKHYEYVKPDESGRWENYNIFVTKSQEEYSAFFTFFALQICAECTNTESFRLPRKERGEASAGQGEKFLTSLLRMRYVISNEGDKAIPKTEFGKRKGGSRYGDTEGLES